jgi:hypothetical protein
MLCGTNAVLVLHQACVRVAACVAPHGKNQTPHATSQPSALFSTSKAVYNFLTNP